MHTAPWHYKLVAAKTDSRGADPFPVGGLPATFGFEASDMEDWQRSQSAALIGQVANLLSGPDGLWPILDADAAKLRFTLQRKKHSSQLWYWQIGVFAQEHRQMINDWLLEAAPQAKSNKFSYLSTEDKEQEILYNYIPMDGDLGIALHEARQYAQAQGSGKGGTLNQMLEYEFTVEDRKRMLTDVVQQDETDSAKLEEANNLVLRDAQTRHIAGQLQRDDQCLQGDALWDAATQKFLAMDSSDMWQVDKMGSIQSTVRRVPYGPRQGKTAGCWWVVYSHKEAAVNAARYIEGIQAAYGSMPYLPVQNMGCKKMPVANSSLYKKVNQQKQAASQPAPTPVAQSHPQPPSSGTYALAAAGDHSHAATYVPPADVSTAQSSLAATSPPADIAQKLEAWKQAQEKKYEK